MQNQTREKILEREQQLAAEIRRLEAALEPLRKEHLDVLRAKASWGIAGRHAENDLLAFLGGGSRNLETIRFLTLKQLIEKALSETFKNGAPAKELIAHFKRAWARDVGLASLSPQLSRLRKDGVIDKRGRIWFLVVPD